MPIPARPPGPPAALAADHLQPSEAYQGRRWDGFS